MHLRDYLEARGESQADFAKRARVAFVLWLGKFRPRDRRRFSISQRTISNIVQGGGCNSATAKAIILATRQKPTSRGGIVTLEDLVIHGRTSGKAA